MAITAFVLDGGAPLKSRPRHWASERVKRLGDVSVAVVVLTILLPVMITAVLAVLVTSGRPIFFCQERIGRRGRPFQMFKFRTMYPDNDDSAHRERNRRELAGELNDDDGIFKDIADPRVTPVGHWFRRFSIDELPQLFNVVIGDMSLVGPRPSLPWEVDMYDARFHARHDVRPGITGLWQVSGRNRLSMREMLELDVSYARGRTTLGDARILLRTPTAVVRGDGAA